MRGGAGPAVRLVHRSRAVRAPRIWGAQERALLDDVSAAAPGWAPWQVLGGPGTGKTALLTDLAVRRIARCDDPESVLVLSHSRRASSALRADITAGLLGAGMGRGATREPMVRTVHSYAFSVLRLQATAHGNPPPRLMTSAEQDTVVREMLRGDIEDGSATWPGRLRPAMPMAGFAAELRSMMLRASERGVGPEDLIRLGRKYAKPEWVAAGKFAVSYEQAMLLRWSVGVEAPGATAPALDAAELVGAALTALATDPELLVRERARIRCLLVDDAQHLDPQAAALVRLLGAGTDLAVVAGDPDQAVFGFRGADPGFLVDLGDAPGVRRIVLGTDHRATAEIGGLTAGIAALLPGRPAHRGVATPAVAAEGVATVRILPTVAKEAAYIANELRRAHLVDEVPWSRMAVIVRSVPLSVAALRRALSIAGVPIGPAAAELPPARRRGAQWMLLVLRALTSPETFTDDDATVLITGPVGGADPVHLRRLRRGLRRAELAAGGERESAELLRLALLGSEVDDLLDGLTDVEAAPLRRVGKVLAKAAVPLRSGRGLEDVLWTAWQASGLERRWAAAALRGGQSGAQADRDLDAAVALFDSAADYVDRLPRATIAGFVDYVEQQRISVDSQVRPTIDGDSVSILSAHAAVGRQWDVVAVAGVQEGIWPSLRPRGSLLGTEVLVELVAGVAVPGEPLSRTAPLLADERRLLFVACSRARRTLLVTAVESTTGDRDLIPSRFIQELIERGAASTDPDRLARRQGRTLALPALVGELRGVVADPEIAATDPDRHRRAAAQLARLAAAGVRGAHPEQWYGLGGASTRAELWHPDDGAVSLSPSTVELLSSCPLRWALERNGGSDGDNARAVAGTLVHTLVQALAGGVPPDRVDRELEHAWAEIDLGSDWYSRRELERTRSMLDNFTAWLRNSRVELTEAGVEVGVECVLPSRGEDDPAVRIRGRIDRLERDPDGRLVIVDVKTGRNPVTKDDAQQHAQLATYQVVAAEGGIAGEPPSAPGGARLVYVAKANAKEGAAQRAQSALDPEAVARWRDTVHDAAVATRGPTYLAVVSDGCRHCPVSGSCPARDDGRQVTGG